MRWPSPPRREAQNASATAAGACCTSSAAWMASAMRSTTPRARYSSSDRSRNSFFSGGDLGGLFLVSGASILDTAQNRGAAERFIDYLLRPENSARNMEKLMYPMPNTEAVRLVKPRARAVLDTLIGGDLSRCDMFGDLGPFNKALDEAWTRLRSE